MGRLIGSVILGYVVMFIAVFALFTAAYMALGPDGAFQAGTYGVSMTWIVLSIAVGLIAALAGGYVCSALGKSPKAPGTLAVVVVILGILSAIPSMTSSDDSAGEARPPDVDNLEAMRKAVTPLWVALLNPVVGAVGVLLGGRLHAGTA